MDTHLPGPGGKGEELELPTWQETLSALRDGKGRERELGEWEGVGRRGGINSEDINSPTFKMVNKVSI